MTTKNCFSCGAPVAPKAAHCSNCGAKLAGNPSSYPSAPPPPPPQEWFSQQQVQQQPYGNQQYQQQPYGNQQYGYSQPPVYYNQKNKIVAGLLGIFLGGFGIHKFYLGRIGWGIVYLLFCWTSIPAFIGFIEGIIYLASNEHNFHMKYSR